MAKRGRKTKLTPELQEKIISAILAGNYIETACAYAGIDKSTYYRWLQKGREQKSGKYRKFYNAIKEAEARMESRIVWSIVEQITTNPANNVQAALKFLEKRFPDRWGYKVKADVEYKQSLKVDEELLEKIKEDEKTRAVFEELMREVMPE